MSDDTIYERDSKEKEESSLAPSTYIMAGLNRRREIIVA